MSTTYSLLSEEQKRNRREAVRRARLNKIEDYREKSRNAYHENKEERKKFNRQRKHNNPERWLLWGATARAKKRGIECTISEQDIKIPTHCPVLGIPIKPNDGKVAGDSLSLDRKDDTKGYIPGNVFVISHRANNLKRNMTVDQIKSLLKYMEE